MKKWIIAVVVVVLIGAAVFYFGHKRTQPTAAKTVVVMKGSVVEKAQAIGYIVPRHSNTVKSAVNGIVAELYHDAGDYVTKGTPLALIKPEPDPSAYAIAYQTLVQDQGQERAALKDVKRFKTALASGLITHNFADYINAVKFYDTAKAQRVLAQQKLALLVKGTATVANKTINNTVKSPITGYVLARFVDIGDPVISLSSAQSSTPMFSMANMHDLMFEGSVDELDAAKIRLHMPATVTVGAESKVEIKGEISNISLQSDQQSANTSGTKVDPNLPFNVSFQVQITNFKLPPNVILRSGYSATADVVIKKANDVLVLPERVLRFDNGNPYVLLPPLKKDAKPKRQPVTVGISDGMKAEIKKGVQLGQKILDAPEINDDQTDQASNGGK